MILKRRIKRTTSLKNFTTNNLTDYGATVEPICTVCKRHKPLNWWVKDCADITCKGHYKIHKKRLLKHV